MIQNWLALNVGNSRLHWAWMTDDTLRRTWNTPHCSIETIELLTESRFTFEDVSPANLPTWEMLPELWIVSVVAEQAQLWETYPHIRTIALDQIPLQNTYSTLGADRALAVWGAIETYGSPILVIDGGTALTFTGAEQQRFVGGAILPGLQLQFRMLGQKTSALPVIEEMTLPDRWATTTIEAIQSGILHTVLAGVQSFIEDWQTRFPQSVVAFTGGDGHLLHKYIQPRSPKRATQIIVDSDLWVWGLRSIKKRSV